MAKEQDKIVGRTIVGFRKLTTEELREECWDEECSMVILDDGTKLYPSRDYEGNAPGVWFGETKKGDRFGIEAVK